ncbi:von Willebrand factor A domain-containing protein 1 [Chanos chanos]|uniref:von Willebrand factor A domain-containing protein 1 n=1 Tax=Chanos chanos TaxID=29144 RepID=A0A6J2UXL4_CHACN|nr:von Willebrand factor A domain-containing protein 1-like [Chanos chanos]
MDSRIALTCFLLSTLFRTSWSQNVPETVLNCCEGDVLFLLDSSGSVASYEYTRMLSFLSELLQPFSLGPDQVRVGLLQVGTEPRLEFDFGAHSSQEGLQRALQRTKQLGGDTNTEEALLMARDQVLRPGAPGGTRPGLPTVLVWLTDGVEPGDIEEQMAQLREEGVSVLVVSTGHGNYQVLREVVTPPAEDHLFFVDIDDLTIITEDLRDAIIEIIRAERLQVRDVSSNSAVLQWRPVLAGAGYYEIRFRPMQTGQTGGGGGPGTSPSITGGSYQRITRPGDSSSAKLTGLLPDTTYTVTLTPETNLQVLNSLTATFTTQPEVMSPAVVTVSGSSTDSIRLSWGPLQPDSVRTYQVEYSPLPTGKLQVVTLSNRQNSTVLTNLQPDTQYLVTVSAQHSSGRERAMSVKACTQEVLPALADLQLTTVGSDSVQVQWKGGLEGLRGYWVTWEGEASLASQRSTLYLPPSTLSTVLTRVPPSARVCVSPVYKTARGEGLCCTAKFNSAAATWSHRI